MQELRPQIQNFVYHSDFVEEEMRTKMKIVSHSPLVCALKLIVTRIWFSLTKSRTIDGISLNKISFGARECGTSNHIKIYCLTLFHVGGGGAFSPLEQTLLHCAKNATKYEDQIFATFNQI